MPSLKSVAVSVQLPTVLSVTGSVRVPPTNAACGGTVPLVLKCTKKLYTADLIGVGASVNTTAAGIFAGAAQPVIGLAMVAASPLAGAGAVQGAAAVGDAGYSALIGILLLMSLPGIAGPLLMRSKLIVR